MRQGAVALFLSALMLPVRSAAHHGWAAFEAEKTATFQGNVTVFHFFNPHAVLEFKIKDASGATIKWQGELTSATRLAGAGWTAATFEFDDEVTVTGYPAKSGAKIMRISKVTVKGKELTVVKGN